MSKLTLDHLLVDVVSQRIRLAQGRVQRQRPRRIYWHLFTNAWIIPCRIRLSDDGGLHWRPGGSAPHNKLADGKMALTSEVAILALANGSLLFNSDSCGLKYRLQSLSTDAGA